MTGNMVATMTAIETHKFLIIRTAPIGGLGRVLTKGV
jgi:hypothetical protein